MAWSAPGGPHIAFGVRGDEAGAEGVGAGCAGVGFAGGDGGVGVALFGDLEGGDAVGVECDAVACVHSR